MDRDIQELVYGLRKTIDEIDIQLKAIEKSDTFKENAELTQKNEKLTTRLDKTEKERAQLAVDNAALKNALYEQYFNEKISTVEKTRKNADIFFANAASGEANRLEALEKSLRYRLSLLKAHSAQAQQSVRQEVNAQIDELGVEIAHRIAQARIEVSRINMADEEKAEFNRLKQERLEGEQITALSRKNNLEKYIGLNILNTVGIVLFIIGAIAAGQAGHIWVSFLLGAGFLVVGEVMNRKRPNVFSLGITAGGGGILYTSLVIGTFAHGTIGLYPALGICIAITAVIFYLSNRYNAQILLAIALIGGYLPILQIFLTPGTPEAALLIGMMVYFVVLNLLALMHAFRKKWTVSTFIGLTLNIIGTFLIMLEAVNTGIIHMRIVSLVYIAFAMAVYNAMPLIATYITKSKFRDSDLALVAINAVSGAFIMIVSIYESGWSHFIGLALAIYAVIYLAVSYFVSKKFEGARGMSNCLLIVGAAFVFVFVPAELSAMWFVPGWMALALAFVIPGILRDKRNLYFVGMVIFGAGLSWFAVVNTTQFVDDWLLGQTNSYFTLQFAAAVAAVIAIMAAFVIKDKLYGSLQIAYKYCAALFVWAFAVFMVTRLWEDILQGTTYAISINYLMIALIAAVTLIFGKIYPIIPRLADGGMRAIGITFEIIALAIIFLLGLMYSPTSGQITAYPTNIIVIATLILIAVELLGMYVLYDIVRRAVLKKIIGIQYFPLIISTYFVVIFTASLTLNYGLSFASFWISAVYMMIALLWTVLGFVRRYSLLRRFGLALALFTVAKLFLFDLHLLTQGFRVLSYFIMATVLVAISFVYQFFSKRLEMGIKAETKDE